MRLIHPDRPTAVELDRDGLATLYAYPPDRTWVRANFVTTVDGSAQGPDGRSGTINAPADQLLFAVLRTIADVILVGAQTTRAEGYKPVRPQEWQRVLRSQLGLSSAPAFAVLSSSGVIDEELRTGGEAPTLVYAEQPVAAVLDDLTSKGHRRILCEGGPSVLAQLAAADRLDELCLTVSPMLVAGHGLRITDGPELETAWRPGLAHVLESDGLLMLRYVRP